jgi:integrase
LAAAAANGAAAIAIPTPNARIPRPISQLPIYAPHDFCRSLKFSISTLTRNQLRLRSRPAKNSEPAASLHARTRPAIAGRAAGLSGLLDWAETNGYRDPGKNPARWKGHLDNNLPARAQIRQVEHHAALPFDEIGPFMARLREREGLSARALELAILTAARTSEVLGAR